MSIKKWKREGSYYVLIHVMTDFYIPELKLSCRKSGSTWQKLTPGIVGTGTA